MKKISCTTLALLLSAMLYAQVGKVGINTTAPQAMLHVKDSSVLFSGAATLPIQPGNPPEDGQGIRTMWYADKAAFRTGFIFGNYGAKDNIGNYSFAAGLGTLAAGSASTALGNFTTASGANSSAFGLGTLANGFGSMVIGAFNNPIATNGQTSMQFNTPLFIVGNGNDNNNRSNVLLVTKQGKVGINTNTTPVYALHINYGGAAGNDGHLGGIMIDATNDDTGEALMNFRNKGVNGTGNKFWMIGLNQNTRNFSFNYGNAPDAQGIEKLIVDSTGNVGIGVVGPKKKLEVKGDIKTDTIIPTAIKFTPNAGLGKVLQSDAAGNASWGETIVNGNVGFGPWGGCDLYGITEYNPVADGVETGDNFGASVSISGIFSIIGSPLDDAAKGSASIYRFNGTTWQFVQKIYDPLGVSGNKFGFSVSMYGDFVFVGSPYNDAGGTDKGSVSVFQFNGTAWVFRQNLADALGEANDNYGISASVFGNTAVVGSPFANTTVVNAGAAFIYHFNGSNWVLLQKVFDATATNGENFGISVSICQNYLIVGEDEDNVAANFQQGSALIFKSSAGVWSLMKKISSSNGGMFDNFGKTVSISEEIAVVGAPFHSNGSNTNQGAAYTFQYNGTDWLESELPFNEGHAEVNFGRSVFIDGSYAIVGADADVISGVRSGSATIFQRIGSQWIKRQYFYRPAGTGVDRFGKAVAFNATSRRFLVGLYNLAVFGKLY
ncbi:MAG: hypothetical protein WAT19_09280 [Ferruginibacter sp.]